MAGELVKTKYTDSEISKVADFLHTAASPIEILQSLFDGAFDDVAASFVVSGLSVSQLATPSMNVQVNPGLAFHRGADKLIHLAAAVSAPVTAAHASLVRLDTVEVRYKETDFEQETRAFKDPASGVVSYALVPTKTKVGIEVRCLAGTPGSGVAPAVESGWMKLAEVSVAAGATAIFNASIKNLTAQADATDNSAWTAEKQVTFSLKSIATIKKDYLAHVAANATGAVTVHGIRQGHGNGFSSDLLDDMQPASAATASTIMQRDANGRAKVANPSATDDIANKGTVDSHAAVTGSSAHGATSAATANQIVVRDASGRAKVASPEAADDLARKDTVDNAVSTHAALAGSSAHGAVSAATANAIMVRDSAGRAKVAAPAASDDIAVKGTVDTHAALSGSSAHGAVSAPTANQLMVRDASGRAQVAAPSAAADIARKDTVDAAVAAEAALARNADNLTSGTVGLDRIPATLTGKDAATVGGKTAPELTPVGSITMFGGVSSPDGWLLCQGDAVSRSTYSALFAALTLSKGTITVTITNPAVFTKASHGLATGDCVELTTTGALPTGFSVYTNYYVIYVDASTFRLASSLANALAGTAIEGTGTQYGTHTLRYIPWGGSGSTDFLLPDFREAAPAGAGTRAAGVADHDAFALGEFKDDTLQGHSHVPYPMSARQDYYVDSNLTGGYQDGRLLGNAIARNDMYTDNSHGTPRVSSVTRGKRLGVNYIIKV